MALKLRIGRQYSYSQIRELIPVSKSTLSVWLRNYPLSKERIKELLDRNERRIERYRDTRRKQRQVRYQRYIQEEKVKIGSFSTRDLFIAGLMIYWGEGGKTNRSQLTISNTNPATIKLAMAWLVKILYIPKKDLRVRLQLYKDMKVDDELMFWSKKLSLPLTLFCRPQIKNTKTKTLNHKGLFGHGTCDLRVSKTEATERVLASLDLLSDYFLNLKV